MWRGSLFGIACAFLLLGQASVLYAQESNEGAAFRGEAMLRIDNDAFTIPSEDEYYTSGLQAEYRYAVDSSKAIFAKLQNNKGSLNKVIHAWTLGHHFYTPFSITRTNPDEYDHPYAGWLYGASRYDAFYGERTQLSIHTDFGVLGPAAMAGPLQRWWHNVLGFDQPVGWEYQIQNTPAINLRLGYRYALLQTRGIQLLSESESSIGTVHNHLQQGFTLRMGELKPVNYSQYTMSKLGSGLRSRKTYGAGGDELFEIYVLAGISSRWVLYNSIIEGGFIGPKSPQTSETEPILWKQHYGFALSGRLFDLSMIVFKKSPEIPGAKRHQYMRIDLVVRW